MLHEYNDIKDIGQALLGRIGKRIHHVRSLTLDVYIYIFSLIFSSLDLLLMPPDSSSPTK